MARANSELARQLEALRQECLKQRQTFEQRLEIEMRGVVEATQECANDLEPRIRRGDIPAVDDFLRWLQVLSDPRAVLSHYKEDATGQAATTENLLEFYRSPYYGKLPAERIRAELYAIKLTGTEVIKPSDRMDMHQVAALLPFARVMILDGSMTDKVRRLKLEERFGATVVAHVHELIQVLETL